MKKSLFILIVIVVSAGLGFWLTFTYRINKDKEMVKVTNFQECVAAGNPVMESYPHQCRAGNQTFVEDIGNEREKSDLIFLETPRPNQTVKSPLKIEGQARGFWFFEGSFPIVLTDWNGLIIGEGIAKAQGEWTTEKFVPFTAEIEFETPKYKNNGTLILKKDNPSGLPEKDDALEIPVFFEKSATSVSPVTSGVTGTVLLGPTCPVVKNPPDPDCADKPYKTTVQVIEANSPKRSPFAVAETDSQGRYTVALPPGEYALQPMGGIPLPRCETKNVTVEPNAVKEVNLSCDSGIR